MFLLLQVVFSHSFLAIKTNINNKDSNFINTKTSNLLLSFFDQIPQNCFNQVNLILTNSQNGLFDHFLKSEWNDFFKDTTPDKNYTVNNQHTQINVDFNKVYIISCSFVKIKDSKSSGGAIWFSTISNYSQMLIEESVFFDCHTISSGGAIYMSNDGSFAINKCCSNFCYSLGIYSNGQFTYIAGESSKIFECSIINSNPETNLFASSTIYHSNRNITINTINLSQNKCYTTPLGNLQSESECFISFCSFKNNTGTIIGIYFSSSQSPTTMTSTNLILNTIEQNGLISSSGELTIKGCTILNNNANLIFQSYIIITVINCTMSEDDVNKTTGTVNIDNWKPSSTFYNEISIQFFNDLCIAPLKKEEDLAEYFIGSFLILIVLLQN